MIEEGSFDEAAHTASSKMREERKTAMSKFIKETCSVCSFYDVKLECLARKHDLSAGKDVIEKLDFNFTDTPYTVLIDRNHDDADYDVSASSDMKEVTRVTANGMKREVNADVFCSSL